MANVIPERARKERLLFYQTRFLRVAGIALLLTAILAYAMLIPAYMALQWVPANSRETMSKAILDNAKDIEDLKKASAFVDGVGLFATSTPLLLTALQIALNARPQGIHITDISYTHSDVKATKQGMRADAGTLLLSGRVDTRDAVQVYASSLRESKIFSTVSVPISVLAGTEDGRFSITLMGAF